MLSRGSQLSLFALDDVRCKLFKAFSGTDRGLEEHMGLVYDKLLPG